MTLVQAERIGGEGKGGGNPRESSEILFMVETQSNVRDTMKNKTFDPEFTL